MSDPNQPFGMPPTAMVPNNPPAAPPMAPPPGGPGGPPFGAPPGYPGGPGGPVGPAGGKSKKGLWITLSVVGVLLVAGLVVLGVILFTGDDDDDDSSKGKDDESSQTAETDDSDEPSGDGPEDAVQAMLDAAADDDCAGAEEYLAESTKALDICSGEEYQLVSSGQVSYEVGEAQTTGATAQVPVTFTSSEGSTNYVFIAGNTTGEWLISLFFEGDPISTGLPTDMPTDLPTDMPTDLSTDGIDDPSGDSTASSVPNDPASVVEGYMSAYVNEDCATADDLTTEAYRTATPCGRGNMPADADSITWDIGTPDVDDTAGTASVPVTLHYQGQTNDSTFDLVQENGQWLVSGDDS